MSSRAERKYRSALQVVVALVAALTIACAHKQEVPIAPHLSVGASAKTIRYNDTIDHVGKGIDSIFKTVIAGEDIVDLVRPVSIGIRDDVMFIADAGDGVIYRYSLTDKRLVPLTGAGDYIATEATDIYVAKDHSFYTTDVDGRRALHFSSDGDLLQIFFDGPNTSRPVAVSVDEDRQEVLVADEVFSHVVAFGMNGEPKYGIGGRGEGPGKFRIITDMVRTPDAFYISDRIELSVQILDRDGKYLAHFGEGELLFPSALALDVYGRVYVAEKAESVIKVFKKGKLVDVIGKNGYGKGEFRFISDMKVHNNKLYVVDSLNGRIQVFDILPEAQVSLAP